MPSLIAVDWGTSSLRGARLSTQPQAQEAPIEERTFPRGILTVPAGGFRVVFDECFGDWMQGSDALCLIAGMAGSKQGWIEAPYCACPAGFDEVAGALAWIEPGRIAIVAGLSCERAGVPDVMRGEETQVFGALRLLGLTDALCVLPGTHSKWVRVRDGRIESFATLMTGEVYALLRQHSILARTMPAEDGPWHEAASLASFDEGVAFAMRGPGLLQTAFSARTLALFDRLPTGQLPSYLSGLVIGEELRSQALDASMPLVLIGSETLTQRYARALAPLGADVQQVGSLATWRGLWEIAAVVERERTR